MNGSDRVEGSAYFHATKEYNIRFRAANLTAKEEFYISSSLDSYITNSILFVRNFNQMNYAIPK